MVFSNRAAMDYDDLRKYVEYLSSRSEPLRRFSISENYERTGAGYLDANRTALGYRAEPDIIRSTQIATFTHGKRMGLQVADAVASS